jgi:hypothetical protein
MHIRNTTKTIISIDPGSESSGIVVLRNTQVVYAEAAIRNTELFDQIVARNSFYNDGTIVLIEDILPYSQSLRLQVIQVCKFIGVLSYRLAVESEIHHELIGRSKVKEYVFNHHYDVIEPYLVKKLARKGRVKQDGTPMKPTFVWVDDRMVAAAMRSHWGIKKPKPGHKNELGISKHAWQALGLATYWIKTGDRQPDCPR